MWTQAGAVDRGAWSGRTFSINNTQVSCTGGNWSSLPAKRNGGYCFQATAGNFAWAYFVTF